MKSLWSFWKGIEKLINFRQEGLPLLFKTNYFTTCYIINSIYPLVTSSVSKSCYFVSNLRLKAEWTKLRINYTQILKQVYPNTKTGRSMRGMWIYGYRVGTGRQICRSKSLRSCSAYYGVQPIPCVWP